MAVEASHLEVCPAIQSLDFYEQGAKDGEGFRARLRRIEAKVARKALMRSINKSDCRLLMHELPDRPDPMPEVGSDEYIEYTAACPAFRLYFDKRISENEQVKE